MKPDLKQESPSNPAVAHQNALQLCYGQKEIEAAEIASIFDYDSDFSDVHKILATHFATREAIATKLEIDDVQGRKWSDIYRNHPQFIAKNKLSATLIVKNEESHIERCLASIKEIADEVIIVDTGSTDRTLEIVRNMNLPNIVIAEFNWINDFSAARNLALSLANHPWRLWIDADEEFDATNIKMLYEGLMRPQFAGYIIQIKNFTEDEGDESVFYHQNIRIFRDLPGIQFENRIHEMVTTSIDRNRYKKANLDQICLIHHGYRPSEVARKDKYTTYCAMLEKEVTENPENGYQWFNLSNIYYAFERFAEQEFAGKNALRLLPKDFDVLAMAYQLVASAQTKLGKPREALSTIAQAKSLGIDNILMSFEKAAAYFNLKEYENALLASDRCIIQDWPRGLVGDYSVLTYKRWTQRSQIFNCLERITESEQAARKALEGNPAYLFSHYHLAVSLELQSRDEEALIHYERARYEPHLEQWSNAGIGRVHCNRGEFELAAKAFEKAWRANPSDYNAWTQWADACEKMGNLDVVLNAYESLSNHHDPTPEALVNFGRVLDRAGKSDRALECFLKAIEKAPQDPNPLFNCGDLLYRLGSYHDAAHLYQLGLKINPQFPDGWFVLGNSLAMIGLNEGAQTAYNQVLQFNPRHEGALHNMSAIVA